MSYEIILWSVDYELHLCLLKSGDSITVMVFVCGYHSVVIKLFVFSLFGIFLGFLNSSTQMTLTPYWPQYSHPDSPSCWEVFSLIVPVLLNMESSSTSFDIVITPMVSAITLKLPTFWTSKWETTSPLNWWTLHVAAPWWWETRISAPFHLQEAVAAFNEAGNFCLPL